jgi:hypothetical protein
MSFTRRAGFTCEVGAPDHRHEGESQGDYDDTSHRSDGDGGFLHCQ